MPPTRAALQTNDGKFEFHRFVSSSSSSRAISHTFKCWRHSNKYMYIFSSFWPSALLLALFLRHTTERHREEDKDEEIFQIFQK
jgi:hypothetical protein